MENDLATFVASIRIEYATPTSGEAHDALSRLVIEAAAHYSRGPVPLEGRAAYNEATAYFSSRVVLTEDDGGCVDAPLFIGGSFINVALVDSSCVSAWGSTFGARAVRVRRLGERAREHLYKGDLYLFDCPRGAHGTRHSALRATVKRGNTYYAREFGV